MGGVLSNRSNDPMSPMMPSYSPMNRELGVQNNAVDASKSINNLVDQHANDDTVDLESLPYFDGHYGVREDTAPKEARAPPKITVMAYSVRNLYFLRFEQRRDWMVITAS